MDDDFVSASHKYVDDLTMSESTRPNTSSGKREDEDGSNLNLFHAVELPMNLESLTQTCDRKGLKANERKTQLLAISAEVGGKLLESKSTMKLLGFVFLDYPNVGAQVENMISRANKRVFVLRYYAAFMPGKDLIKLYCSLVRSIYSYVTYHSMLTKTQERCLNVFLVRILVFRIAKGIWPTNPKK